MQGPAELLPVSSSGHLVVVPWLLRWPYAELDPELRKSFEVALHAGTACALLLGLRRDVADFLGRMGPAEAAQLALGFGPAALVGYRFERPIEQRLGGPLPVCAGLAIGSVAMAAADRAPQQRTREDATPLDSLILGIAQACALMPGISRNGATLAAARARRFTRGEANELSRRIALPIIVGASLLKAARLRQRGLEPGTAAPFAAGFAAAFGSTLASVRLIGMVERSRSLAPYAAYRLALAGVVAAELRRRCAPRRACAPAEPATIPSGAVGAPSDISG